VYVGSVTADEFDHSGGLFAFDARGITGCSGSPKVCAPLWHADTYAIFSSPTVANGVVYVSDDYYLLDDSTFALTRLGKVRAFDARGTTGCSGSPKACQPLWTSDIGPSSASPTVANGVVYATASLATFGENAFAFDAAGVTACAGSPKTCGPVGEWNVLGTRLSSPTVVDGHVFVSATDLRLYALTSQ
jgi:hypothetical protein